MKALQRAIPGLSDTEEAIRAFAATDLLEGGSTDLAAVNSGGTAARDEFGGFDPPEQLRAEIDLQNLDFPFQCAAEFTQAFGNEEPAGSALRTVT